MATDSPPTFAVLGLGAVGRMYANIARDVGCSIVGADANAKHRRRFEEEFGVETFEDLESMDLETVDAAIVATPNRYHETAAKPAIRNDLHVFFEKPLAHNYESAKRIVDAADRSDGICMVGYYLAFYECVDVLQTYIDESYFGDISHVESRYLFRRGVPRRGSWYTSKEIAGGGVLQDKGSFAIHLLACFGVPLMDVDSVMVKTRSQFGNRDDYTSLDMWGGQAHENIFDVEDSLTAFLEFGDGTTATLETAWAVNAESEHTHRIRGTDGGASLDVLTGDLTLYGVRREDPGWLVTSEAEPNYAEDVFSEGSSGPSDLAHSPLRRRAFRHFLECIERGKQPEHGNLEEALSVQRAIQAIYDADDTADA